MPRGYRKDGSKLGFQKGYSSHLKGTNLSLEHKEKLRKPLKKRGHKSSCSCCICQQRRGEFVYTPEILEKMLIKKKGIPRPAHSKLMKGRGNPRYIDGRSMLRYPSEFSRRVRRKIWERDNYTCQKCGVGLEQHLNKYRQLPPIHHIDYIKKNCQENNLVTLCKKCNSLVNTNREHWKEYFSEKIIGNGSNKGKAEAS